jgi:NADH-quinone oxidoreductase subunit C
LSFYRIDIMTHTEMVAALKSRFGASVLGTVEFRGEQTVNVTLASIHEVMAFAKGELGFDYLVDISSLDHLGEEPRFEMVYELYGYGHGRHLRIKCKVSEDESVPTVSDLWLTADWHEREAYDMMGIDFAGHPDLRRILMWEGYPFFPLRKDFPLEGRPSDMPDVAFTGVAPLEGGPFVTSAGGADTVAREPRARRV